MSVVEVGVGSRGWCPDTWAAIRPMTQRGPRFFVRIGTFGIQHDAHLVYTSEEVNGSTSVHAGPCHSE